MADKDWAREDTRALALSLNASADEQRSGGARLLMQRCRRSPAHTAPGQRSDLAFVRPAPVRDDRRDSEVAIAMARRTPAGEVKGTRPGCGDSGVPAAALGCEPHDPFEPRAASGTPGVSQPSESESGEGIRVAAPADKPRKGLGLSPAVR